jgi:type IV secretion system protein VirB1
MRTAVLLLAVLLASPWVLPAQRLTLAEFRGLGRACAPEANGRTLLALARTEPNLNPWALSVNRPGNVGAAYGLRLRPSVSEASARGESRGGSGARELEATGVTVSVGILQVNVEGSPYSAEQLLDPCRNLKEGWSIFRDAYGKQMQEFGEGQRALLAAFGAYNAGTALEGFRNGYVLSILTNAY